MVRKLGTGLWESTKGLGKLQLRFFDPASGQAGYFGTLDEVSGTAIVTLRLKVEDRKITEAEWVLARKGDPGLGPLGGEQANAAFHNPDYLLAHPPAERAATKAGRVEHVELLGTDQRLVWKQTASALQVTLPGHRPTVDYAPALKIHLV